MYSNHSPRIISTVHTDKIQIEKDINIENHHNISKIQLVATVHNTSGYYIRTSLSIQPSVSQSSLCLLHTEAQRTLITRRYLPDQWLPFIENTSSTTLT